MVKDLPPINVNLDSLRIVEERIFGKVRRAKKGDAVVKVSAELMALVEEFINLEENKFRYANRKQFVDLAVFEKLKRGK